MGLEKQHCYCGMNPDSLTSATKCIKYESLAAVAADQLPVVQTVTQCTDTQPGGGYITSHTLSRNPYNTHMSASRLLSPDPSNNFPGSVYFWQHLISLLKRNIGDAELEAQLLMKTFVGLGEKFFCHL